MVSHISGVNTVGDELMEKRSTPQVSILIGGQPRSVQDNLGVQIPILGRVMVKMVELEPRMGEAQVLEIWHSQGHIVVV